MRTEERLPYESVDDMVDESAMLLMRERIDGGRHRRTWVLPSEVAFFTGLDEQVVMEAMLRLDGRSGAARSVAGQQGSTGTPDRPR